MNDGLAIDSWQDVATLLTIVATSFTVLGIVGTLIYNRFKNKREDQAADDEASDRLIALITQEADKRVAIVRAEFELAIAELKLEHAKELNSVRADFQRQIAAVQENADAYRCDVVPCASRRRREPSRKAGGTD